MAVRRSGNRWAYDFMIKRIRYRGAIPEAQTQRDAKDAEAAIRREVFEGTFGRPKGDGCFVEFAEKVFLPWAKEHKRSWKDDKYHIETFKAYFKGKSFRELTPMLIEKFKKDRRHSFTVKKQPRSVASVNRELACLSKIFSLAIRDHEAASNPCSQVERYRENNERMRYLTPEEEIALLGELTGGRAHLRPIVEFAIHTGMRRGEILSMKHSWIDLARGCIRIPGEATKNGKPRNVPMNQVVRELVAARGGSIMRSDGLVFKNPRTDLALRDIKKGFVAACKDAKVEDFHFHDLRHTFGTRLADTGADPFVIAEIMGHSDLRMTKRYCHATDQRKQGAVERIADYRAPENCHKIVTGEERKVG
ncbi:MAG TPA: tyrosine-type recombinase/integrase [Blastocatellia bacterium]|nr:tyrosine-type recombinase/integrase [Blastocatellia bacterium]